MWLPSWSGKEPRFWLSLAIEPRYAGPWTSMIGKLSVAARIAWSASCWRAILPLPILVRPSIRNRTKPGIGIRMITINQAIAADGFLLWGNTPRARNFRKKSIITITAASRVRRSCQPLLIDEPSLNCS